MKKTIRRALLAILVPALLASAWMTYYANTLLSLPRLPFEFTLKHGSSLRSVARQLTEAGVLRKPWAFTALVRLFGKASAVKAGNYQLDKNLTPMQLFRKITEGDVTQSEITFIEGWNFGQLRKALDEHPGIRHETRGLSEQEILARIGADKSHAEGLFFPDTYFFSTGMSDVDILRRAYQTMSVHLAKEWEGRAPGLPYTIPYQALIMASIIEKETGQAGERPLVAAVFVNRLRLGMRLQTDPTVIYGLGQAFDGNLHKRDLTTDGPYNTYTRAGLPPTPIAMPGLESIHAALHPAANPVLYFVAKGNGTHKFSVSLAEHNRAVARYQLRR